MALKKKTLFQTSSSLVALHLAFFALTSTESMAMRTFLQQRGASDAEQEAVIKRTTEKARGTEARQTQENVKIIEKKAEELSGTKKLTPAEIVAIEEATRGQDVSNITKEQIEATNTLTKAGVKKTTPEQLVLLNEIVTGAGKTPEEAAKFIRSIQSLDLKSDPLVAAAKAIAGKAWKELPNVADVKAYAALTGDQAALAATSGAPTEDECHAYGVLLAHKIPVASAADLSAAVAIGNAINHKIESEEDLEEAIALITQLKTVLGTTGIPDKDVLKTAWTVVNLKEKATPAITEKTITKDQVAVARALTEAGISLTDQKDLEAAVAFEKALGKPASWSEDVFVIAKNIVAWVGDVKKIADEDLAAYKLLAEVIKDEDIGKLDKDHWAILQQAKKELTTLPSNAQLVAAIKIVTVMKPATPPITAANLTKAEIILETLLSRDSIDIKDQTQLKAILAYSNVLTGLGKTVTINEDFVEETLTLLELTGSVAGITDAAVQDFGTLQAVVAKGIGKEDAATWKVLQDLRTKLGKAPSQTELEAALTTSSSSAPPPPPPPSSGKMDTDLASWGVKGALTAAQKADYALIDAASKVPGALAKVDQTTWDVAQALRTKLGGAPTENNLEAMLEVFSAAKKTTPPMTISSFTKDEVEAATWFKASDIAIADQNFVVAALYYKDAKKATPPLKSADLYDVIELLTLTGDPKAITAEAIADFGVLKAAVTASVPHAAKDKTTWQVMESARAALKAAPDTEDLTAALAVIHATALPKAIDVSNITGGQIKLAKDLQAAGQNFTTQKQIDDAEKILAMAKSTAAEDLKLNQIDLFGTLSGKAGFTGTLGTPNRTQLVEALDAFNAAGIDTASDKELKLYCDILYQGGITAISAKSTAWKEYADKVAKDTTGPALITGSGNPATDAAAFVKDILDNKAHSF